MTLSDHVHRALLAFEAALLLTAASIGVALLPRRWTPRLLGHARAPGAAVPSSDANAEARRIGRAVERVASVLPWRPVCLPRAIATAAMLRRRAIACESHLGVSQGSSITAHAWVTVGGIVVQGSPVDRATEIASFR